MGHDPFRHGRFTIIVNRGFIAFIKQNNGTLYKLPPLLAVQYRMNSSTRRNMYRMAAARHGDRKRKSFFKRLNEKGVLQFEDTLGTYTIHSAWLKYSCCQKRLKENYYRLVVISGDHLGKRDPLKSKKYMVFTESVLENIEPVKEMWYINLIISFVRLLALVPELNKAENCTNAYWRCKRKCLGKGIWI